VSGCRPGRAAAFFHAGSKLSEALMACALVEEIAGVEITDNEADQIEVVGDLIHYIDERRN
jgi:hypothetical protein